MKIGCEVESSDSEQKENKVHITCQWGWRGWHQDTSPYAEDSTVTTVKQPQVSTNVHGPVMI